jgi:hypothetical protein
MKAPSKLDAILSLVPGAQVAIYNEDTIVWNDPTTAPVTNNQINTELARLNAIWQYQHKRAAEYPSIGDQLDALWKGGSAAEEMLAKVQAVKDKYPKE